MKVYITKHQQEVLAGEITTRPHSKLFDPHQHEPITLFVADSPHRQVRPFYTQGAAELWLKTVAYIHA